MFARLALPFLLVAPLAAQSAADLDKEAELGKLMAQQFRERNGRVQNAEAQAYLERLVRELAQATPGDAPCCSVELYASAAAPAKPTAYPGGYLFVPAKLFFTSADEEAFVLALAHAVAHVRLRDWNTLPAENYASIPLNFVGPEQDDAAWVPLGMRKAFDAREERADRTAAVAAKSAATGRGEFERIRDHAPLPTPRPSLLP